VALDGEIRPGDTIRFDPVLPVGDERIHANIASCLARGLPEAKERRQLTVVAGGPSAAQAPLTGDTMALNGSLKLFTRAGLSPTYWAACDPQALVADFLIDAPTHTTYFVASKCDPLVFDMLGDRDVRAWHLRDHPAQGKFRQAVCHSVTMSAIWLAVSLGYTDFDIWGWDGCFVDGEHHAGDGEIGEREITYINYGGIVWGDDVIGGRNYPTTRTWALEAEGAQQLFQIAEYFDLRITIHGDGMMKACQASILAKD
jgi:hypothetical protein